MIELQNMEIKFGGKKLVLRLKAKKSKNEENVDADFFAFFVSSGPPP